MNKKLDKHIIGSRCLKIVQRYHPNVIKVVDSKHDLIIDVMPEDDTRGEIKNHAHCAMARACQRQEHADGAIISVRSAYIIKGDTAIRYRVPESVSREIVSFDRKGGFYAGTYKMNAPCRGEQLGYPYSGKKPARSSNRLSPTFRHKTQNIRTSLNIS